MARSGVIQWIRLQLDRGARRRAVEEARAAGREMGDGVADGARRGARQAQDEVNRFPKAAGEAGADGGRKFRKGFEQEGGKLKGFLGTVGGWIAATFSVLALKSFIEQMFLLGTAAQETQSKFNTTFGQQGAAQLQAFLDKWASLAGLNKTVGQDFAATAGAIAEGMGATRVQAAKFSEQWLRTAGDLESFHNVPIERTFAAIRGGVTGEYEMLKSLGIVIRQTDIDSRALMDTHKGHAKELNNLERAQAALNLIIERAGPAMGDLERTQSSTANQARNLKAEYENLKIELATGMLPIFAASIDHVNQNKKGLLEAANAVGLLARVLGGILWQALNTVASFMAGGALSSVALLKSGYHGLELALLDVVLGYQKLKNAMGMGSDQAVTDARAARDEARAALHRDDAEFREGLRTWAGGFTTRNFQQVWNMRGAQGTFDWSTVPPLTPITPATPPNTGKDHQVRDLSQDVSVLERASEFRERIADFDRRALQVQAEIAAAARAQNLTLERRIELMTLAERIGKVIDGTDAASERKERERLKVEQDRQNEQQRELGLLERMGQRRGLTAEQLASAQAIEASLTAELGRQNTTLERQLEILDQLDRARALVRENDPQAKALREGPPMQEDDPRFQKDVEDILSYWDNAAQAIAGFADGVAEAWGAAFDLIIADARNVSGALAALGKGVAKALLGGLASYAQGKVQENIASAIEELAKAAAAAGNPFLAWSVPVHLKSAATHGLAAAAWGVLAGGAGAGARAVGGGGGGATSAGGAGRVGGSTADAARASAPEVHIYVDGIDPYNARHQDLVGAAHQQAVERYGQNARITVHPRGT